MLKHCVRPEGMTLLTASSGWSDASHASFLQEAASKSRMINVSRCGRARESSDCGKAAGETKPDVNQRAFVEVRDAAFIFREAH